MDPAPPMPAAVLELVAMQLEVAMQNAAAKAERLSCSIADFSALGTQLGAKLRAHAQAAGDPELLAIAQSVVDEAGKAMVAMQFHDQLVQRVTHVRQALGDLHDELLNGNVPDWTALLHKMRGHYTMEDERRLFDLVLGVLPGAPDKHHEDEALPSSVELF